MEYLQNSFKQVFFLKQKIYKRSVIAEELEIAIPEEAFVNMVSVNVKSYAKETLIAKLNSPTTQLKKILL